ncbi:MAG: YceD family protein [Candidatus Accumulibacter sp.]|nr:YceD family protein [Accumulibacter sp.]
MPQVIDSLAFARDAGSLEGILPIAGFFRLRDWLAGTAGNVVYRLEGGMSDRERPRLLLRIDALLLLRCQRCLKAIRYPLKLRSVLECVGEEEALTHEDIGDDAVDFLPVRDKIDIAALIEEEMILSLPIAPRHENCVLPDAGKGGAEKVSPFSVLKSLKNGKI